MKKVRIAILIPCYNEAKTIGKVVKDCKKYLPKATIYVYNNNSTDRTVAIARRHGAIVRNVYKQGKGNVIRAMFREIDADCYLMVDGDDTYSLTNAKEMTDLVLKENYDIVIGDRLSSNYFKKNKRRFHNTGNKLVRFLINMLFHSKIHDVMTGYRAFSYEFVKSCPILSPGFEVETEMTIHALDKRINYTEIPVEYKERPKGSISKLKTFRDGFKVLRTIFNMLMEYRPLKFFSFISLIFFIISVIFGYPVFNEYFKTGLVPRFPTLIFAGFMLMISVIALTTGIILNVVVKKHRFNYECLLINIKR